MHIKHSNIIGSLSKLLKVKFTQALLYKKYRKKLYRKTWFGVSSIILLLFISIYTNHSYNHRGILSLLIINTVGIYISWLLLQKQLHIQNNLADSICSKFKNSDCNSVLTSPAAKPMGVIGWSEIGLSYFTSNLLLTVFFPQFIPYLALINIAGLFYGIWSIWYQKYRVKQWCPLCLIVQFLMWTICISNTVFAYISIPQYSLLDIASIGGIYIAPIFIIKSLLPAIKAPKELKYLRKEIHRLRPNPEVFKALLHQQPHYRVDHSTSRILWGHKEANLIVTIVTNPHCTPCAIMHKRIEQLLARANDSICIQYVFHSFNTEYESSSLSLIATYFSSKISKIEKVEIYNQWFEVGRKNNNDFFKRYSLNIDHEEVLSEISNHKHWEGLKSVQGTPAVFINGYRLPPQYQIEDIIYFVGLNV